MGFTSTGEEEQISKTEIIPPPDELPDTNLLQYAISYTKAFIETNGWKIIFLLIIIYLLYPYFLQWRPQVSLKSANDPNRKNILDEGRKRARMHQQLDVYKANREHKHAATLPPKDVENNYEKIK